MLDGLANDNADTRRGAEIVRQALRQPCYQIAKNAGVDASVVVSKVMEAGDANVGYDALNDKYVDMIQAGIIDPTKVMCDVSKMSIFFCLTKV